MDQDFSLFLKFKFKLKAKIALCICLLLRAEKRCNIPSRHVFRIFIFWKERGKNQNFYHINNKGNILI